MRISMRAVGCVVLFSGVFSMPFAQRALGAEAPAGAKTTNLVNVQAANEKTLRELRTITPGLDPFEEPLTDVLNQISQTHDLNIIIDSKAIEDAALPEPSTMQVTINLSGISLGTALDLLLSDHGLTYTIREGILIISTIEAIEQNLLIGVYPVRNLLDSDHPLDSLEELIHVISVTVETDSWEEVGGPAVISQYQGNLVIAQTLRNHLKIKKLLSDLGQALQAGGGPNFPLRAQSPNATIGGGFGGAIGGGFGGREGGGEGGGGFFRVADDNGDDLFGDSDQQEANGAAEDDLFAQAVASEDDNDPFGDSSKATVEKNPFDFGTEGGDPFGAEAGKQRTSKATRESLVRLERQQTPPAIDLERIVSVDFDETSLEEAVQEIGDICGFPVAFYRRAIEDSALPDPSDLTVTLKLEKASVKNVLRQLLREHDLAYTVNNDIVLVTSLEDAETWALTRLCSVRDLLNAESPNESMDKLIELIEKTVHPESWEELGGSGTISSYQGILAISTTLEVHDRVDEFLASLREVLVAVGGPTLPVPVAPRAVPQQGHFGVGRSATPVGSR